VRGPPGSYGDIGVDKIFNVNDFFREFYIQRLIKNKPERACYIMLTKKNYAPKIKAGINVGACYQ
jgi:hypothetical protein